VLKGNIDSQDFRSIMKEIFGNLWDFYKKPGFQVCITTNGFIKNNGRAVMGRGSAREAVDRIPDVDILLAEHIRSFGNAVGFLTTDPPYKLLVFPVKHNWWEMGNMNLILASAHQLFDISTRTPEVIYILGRPGCNNGRLEWNGEDGVRNLISFLPDNVHVITRKVVI